MISLVKSNVLLLHDALATKYVTLFSWASDMMIIRGFTRTQITLVVSMTNKVTISSLVHGYLDIIFHPRGGRGYGRYLFMYIHLYQFLILKLVITNSTVSQKEKPVREGLSSIRLATNYQPNKQQAYAGADRLMDEL